jgi:peptidyl-prolyl cis-trans isomerase B (cyclophilin B)
MFVEFETTEGTFKIKLNADKAPKSVENFLKYVDSDFYKGTIFHRVIPGFMVQGGGMTADMNQKPTQAPVQNEADNGLKNKRGTLAMARTNDPHSATAQFFVNLVDNGFLDYTSKSPSGWGYAVFGEVIEGMDVIDAMTKIPTGDKGYHQNVPKKVIEIKSTKRVEK